MRRLDQTLPGMKDDTEAMIKQSFKQKLLQGAPILVLVAGLTCSFFLFLGLQYQDRELDQSRFDRLVHDANTLLLNQMDVYVEALRGGAALVIGSQEVRPEEWAHFVDTLDLIGRHPGLGGLGIVEEVHRQDIAKFTEEKRKNGLSNFKIHEVPNVANRPETDLAFPISFIEPWDRNHKSHGLDLASETNRFQAATFAKESGLPRATKAITLIRDQKEKTGFLVYLPVYKTRQAKSIGSIRERDFLAWIYSPLIAEEFFASSWNQWAGAKGEIEFSVFPEGQSAASKVIYSNQEAKSQSSFEVLAPIDLHGIEFNIGWKKGPDFPTTNRIRSMWISLASAILTLAIAFIIRLYGNTNVKAKEIAAGLTRDLARSESRFQMVVESAPNGMIMFDTDGQIVLANDETEKIFGYSHDELTGQNIAIFQLTDTRKKGKGEAELSLLDPAPKSMSDAREMHGQRSDGATVFVDMGLMPIEVEGKPYVLAGIVDSTKKVEANRQLREMLASQKALNEELAVLMKEADGANEAKSTFLANMSHEIRTPMNSVLGMGELLERSKLNDDQRHHVRILRNAGNSMLQLINGVLDLAKVESGSIELENVNFDLLELLESSIEVMAVPAHRKSLNIILDAHHSLPKTLCGDPLRLRQVFVNLLGNAIKFTEFGSVIFEVKLLSILERKARVEFLVKDTGIGIAPENLSKLFQPFSQIDSSTAREYGGTGLGLALSDRLVKLMDSNLDVRSELDKGTTFSFTAEFQVVKSSTPIPATSRPFQSRTAVFYTQDATFGKVIERDLSQLGLKTRIFSEPRPFIELIEESKAKNDEFDVLLMDTTIGNESSLDFIARINQLDPIAHRTIVLFHGTRREKEIEKCETIGVGGWLMKPTRKDRLYEEIGFVLNGKPESSLLPAEEMIGGQAPSNEKPKCVLIVDDTEDNRILIEAYLRDTDIDFDFASNGREAVVSASTYHYDAVLMDMQMPIMDGYAATKAIRTFEEQNGSRHTPIIAVTADALAEDRTRALQAGCDSHLSKPVSSHSLLKMLDRFGVYSVNPALSNSDGGVEFHEMTELVERYVRNKGKLIDEIVLAAEIGDFDFVSREAHKIKGTGTSFGFPILTQISSEVVYAAHDKDKDAMLQLAAELQVAMTEIQNTRPVMA